MEAFLLRLDELEDDDKRASLIEEIYDNGQNADDDLSGTRARVNALYRIIRAGREIEALETVIHSDRVAKENPQAGIRIKSGKFIY